MQVRKKLQTPCIHLCYRCLRWHEEAVVDVTAVLLYSYCYVYVFLLLCMLRSVHSVFIVPTGILRLPLNYTGSFKKI